MTGIHYPFRRGYSDGMPAVAISTSDLSTDKPPRHRRWIPLSLRMFVAILAVVGVAGVTWLGVRIYRHEAALAAIERAGGKAERVIGGPAWLRRLPGGDWIGRVFENVEMVNLDKS